MEKQTLLNLRILPPSDNPVFDQRETGLTHTSYMEETAFYSLIQSGNVEAVRASLNAVLKKGIVVGRLSEDSLRQMQYWAVCCITIGMRYAIQGGLDEMTAYNLADSYIMAVDKMSSERQIADYLEKIVIEITTAVRDSHRNDYPIEIIRCLDYIDKHLHDEISLDILANAAGYSKSYLSKLFKAKVGKNISEYIMLKKLEEAKALLRGGTGEQAVAYYLGFCSQTYFISRFKRQYGVTPLYYQRHNRV